MTEKSIKIIFYSLFTINILAGIIVVYNKIGLLAGILTYAVLMSLNGVVFAIMLKILRIGEKHGKQK